MNTQKVVGKVGKCNICFRQEQLTSHTGTELLHDFVQQLGVASLLKEELRVKARECGGPCTFSLRIKRFYRPQTGWCDEVKKALEGRIPTIGVCGGAFRKWKGAWMMGGVKQ